MSIFAELPNEILLQIIKETSADDIAALASCCKHLHFLAQGRLDYHRKKRAEAEDIVVGWDMGRTSAIHPSKHLQDILEDNDCRFYTKGMIVGSLAYGDPYDDEKTDEGRSLAREKAALIDHIETKYGDEVTALVTKVYTALLPYAAKTGLNSWIEQVKWGEPAAVVILLLALYPNLKILFIYEPGQDWWKEVEYAEVPYGNLFQSLATTAMQPATNTLRVLSKLSDFRLTGDGDDGGLEANAEMITPFMALPTMRKILGEVVDGRNIRWLYGTGTSKVTVFDLEGDIDRASLSEIIRGIKALEHFRYQFSSPVAWMRGSYGESNGSRLKWGPRAINDAVNDDLDEDDSDEDYSIVDDLDLDPRDKPRWEPRAIIASLLQYASHSLVSLDLTAAGFRGAVRFLSDEPFLGSLRSFRALKYVNLDTMMLFKKVKCSSNVSLLRHGSIQETSWEEIRAQWLVNFLPMSIEGLGMTYKYVGKGLSKEDVAAMFTGLPELSDRLPNLFAITVEKKKDRQGDHREKEGWEELCLRCEENDIELSLEES